MPCRPQALGCSLQLEGPRTLLSGNDHGGPLVFDQEDDQLCRLCLAGIPSNDVHVIRCFIKGLSGFQGYFLSASHLHNHGPLKDIDNGLSVMPMNWIYIPGKIGSESCRE